MTPTTTAEEFLDTRLGVVAGLGGRFWQDEAPEGESYPLCVYEYQDGEDRVVVSGNIKASELLYAVGVWVKNQDYRAAEELFDDVHLSLHGQKRATTPSGQVTSCFRERHTSVIKRTYKEGTSVFRYVGAIYRIRVESGV